MSPFDRLDTGKLWLVLGALCVGVFLFFNRWIFFERFDAPSLLNLYERSQWSIPESSRILADAELYQVSGYDLVHGGSPFDINPETPPLGKYAYGLSIVATQNPYAASLVFFATAATLFWILTGLTWKDRTPRFIALGIFLSMPPLLDQMRQTMLDMPQLIGILVHVISVLKLRQATGNKRWLWASLAGVGIGIFLGSKIGVFAPALALASLALLPLATSWPLFILMGASAGLTYLVSYLPALLSGLSLLDWARGQKWIVTFYASSKLPRMPWSAPAYLLTGFFSQQLAEPPRWIQDWTPLWPLTLGATAATLQRWKTLDPQWRYFLTLTAALGLMMLVSPFFPRYLLDIAPFLILFLTHRLWKASPILNASLGCFCVCWLLWHVNTQPQTMADHLEDRWEAGAHEEVYNLLAPLNRLAFTRGTYAYSQKNIDRQLQTTTTDVEIEIPSSPLWSTRTQGSLVVRRQTPLGVLRTEHPVSFIQEHGRWRLEWDWDMTLPGFDPQAEVVLETRWPKFGTLKSQELEELSSGGERPFVTVYPSNLHDSEAFIHDMAPLLGTSGLDLRNRIYVLGEGLGSVPLGFLGEGVDETQLEELRHNPALSIELRPARVHQDRFMRPDGSNMLEKYEANHPELAPAPAGRAYLKWSNGKTIELVSSEGREGTDVTLDISAKKILEKESNP